MAAAIEAGAQDLEPADEGATRFFTEPTELDLVNRALASIHGVDLNPYQPVA